MGQPLGFEGLMLSPSDFLFLWIWFRTYHDVPPFSPINTWPCHDDKPWSGNSLLDVHKVVFTWFLPLFNKTGPGHITPVRGPSYTRLRKIADSCGVMRRPEKKTQESSALYSSRFPRQFFWCILFARHTLGDDSNLNLSLLNPQQ